ncbi:hypothetical protein [Sphingomonas fuzhouensis]|uniref:hypothetical protein n=1 Tax=Sphingomonas fuzhouensis TaxID=3106033 RepID=UPI002AFEF4DF|nr:hypothetical protein [Sphingomonas sp. SGZ-02]
MAKKRITTGSKALAVYQPARDVIHKMAGGTDLVQVDAVFHVPAVRPTGPGPWAQEADKVAWTDHLTGLGCIIRRSPVGRHLCGYVSVPPGHPLFGRRIGTLGDHLIGVHNGLVYAAACQAWEPEEVSVCHPSEHRVQRIVPGSFRQNVHMNEAAASGDDAWWFGFSCDQVDDITPTTRTRGRTDHLLDGVGNPTYKTEAFVYRECLRLAAQLHAIGEGRDPREADPGPVANGYDPRRNEG